MDAEELGNGIPNTPTGRGSVVETEEERELGESAGDIGGEEDLETGANGVKVRWAQGRLSELSARASNGNGRSNVSRHGRRSRGDEEGCGHGTFTILRPSVFS